MVCFLGALIFLGTFCNLLHFSFVLLVREKNREESNEGMRLSIQELVDEYKDNIYAVAFNVCKNAQDAEDVVQDTFISYYTEKKEFENRQHIRAWLIRVAINKAKNVNRTFWRRNVLSLKDYMLQEEKAFLESQGAEDASIQANCTIICTIRKNDINNLSNGKCKYVILCGKNPKIIV